MKKLLLLISLKNNYNIVLLDKSENVDGMPYSKNFLQLYPNQKASSFFQSAETHPNIDKGAS